MSDRLDPPDWIVEQTGLTALALGAALIAVVVILPYLQYVLVGVVLAYILLPLQRRLERHVRPTIAAVAMVVVALLVVLLPLVYLATIAVRQSLRVGKLIREGALDVQTIEEVLATNGFAVDLVNLYKSNQDRIATALEGVTNSAINVAGGLPNMFIGLTITLFVLFALLRDGAALVAWIQWALPVEDEILSDLRSGLDELMWASVVGNVAVAAIQAVALGIGLAIIGVPAVIFLTVAAFVLLLLPLVGVFGIWIPAAIYLFAVGRPTASTALVVYGLVVTFSDSYLRPALIGQTSAYNAVIVIVGIFGGLATVGPVGLFLGPVMLGGAKLTIDAFGRARTGETSPGSEADDARDRADVPDSAEETASPSEASDEDDLST